MSRHLLIGGICGTTRLALYLLDTGGGVIDFRSGPGVSRMAGKAFEDVLFDLCADWVEQAPGAPIVLSGMAGSTMGWTSTPYLECPLEFGAIPKHCVMIRSRGHRVFLAPGLACTNALGQADVMRGEETELLAWKQLRASPIAGERCIVCVPGTHSKWVRIRRGRIESFLSCATGELFHALRASGVLASKESKEPRRAGKAFLDGVSRATRLPKHLLSLLFGARAEVVRERMDPVDGPEFLSGLLIGADVASARAALEMNGLTEAVPVIGRPELTRRYVLALEYGGVPAAAIDASVLAPHGLSRLYAGIEQHQ